MLGTFTSGSQFLYARHLAIVMLGLLCGCSDKDEVVSLIRVSLNDLPYEQSQVVMETQMALIPSPFVVAAAVRNLPVVDLPIFKDVEDPACWVQDHLNVSHVGDSEIISVSLNARPTDDAIRIVDAVVDAYLEEIAGADRRERVERLELLRRATKENVQHIREVSRTIHLLESEQDPQDDVYRALMLEEAKLLVARIGKLESRQVEAEIAMRLATAGEPGDRDSGAVEVDPSMSGAETLTPPGGDSSTSSTEAGREPRDSPSVYETAQRQFAIISEVLADERTKLDAVMGVLRQSKFLPELRIEKERLDALLARANELEQEIHELEMQLQQTPRINRVQPALLVHGADVCK